MPVRDLKIDRTTGDLALDPLTGDLAFVSDLDAIAQAIDQKLSLFRGEYFLDESLGMPYFEEIFVKNPNMIAVREWFRTTILSVDGVLEVKSLSLDYVTVSRDLSVDFIVSTDLGELSQTFEVNV